MKRVGFVSTALVMFALLGATAFGYAQQGQQHDNQGKQEKQAKPEKGNQQHARQQQKQNQNNQQHAQQQQKQDQNTQQKQQKQSARRQQPERTQHTQLQRTQQQRRQQESEQHGVWQQRRARSWDSEHRTWQQRGGYNGYRIPDNYFRSYYGRDHWFRVYSLPFMMYGGYPRYQYRGYWISFLDPYPEYWGDNWYQNDDVYVDYYNDGYYLYNRRYPGRPGIAISFSF